MQRLERSSAIQTMEMSAVLDVGRADFCAEIEKKTFRRSWNFVTIAAAWMGFMAVLWQPSLQIAAFVAFFCLAAPLRQGLLDRYKNR